MSLADGFRRGRRSARPDSGQPGNRAATEQASLWVVRRSGQPPDARAQSEFETWYQADASHAAAYDRLARVWRSMAEVDRAALRARPARKRRAAAAALLAALALPAWLGLKGEHPLADYRSGAEVLNVALPDGSRVVLDARSALDVDFSAGRREVRLLAGRALFEPAPRTPGGAPFTVLTGQASATALGTRYTVSRQQDSTRVAVYEHSVALRCLVCADSRTLTLEAGEGADVSPAGILPDAPVRPAPPAWTRGLLVFDDVPLAEAAQRLSRYTRKHILVLGGPARAVRVSGTAQVSDPARALSLLLAQTPVRIDELPGLLVLRMDDGASGKFAKSIGK